MAKKIFFLLFLPFLIFFGFIQTVQAQNAILYFSPAKGSFRQGESFWLTIMVDTKGELVNAVAAYLSYPEDKLQALGVSTTNSVMTTWAEKNAGAGKIEIAGGTPTPGFSGIKKIASIGFKVKIDSGSVNLKFTQDSAVLRDSDNKNILNLTISGQGNYSFLPPEEIKPPPEEKPPVEIKAPVISDIVVKEIGRTTAIISWKTDIDSDSIVEYGLTTDYGLIVSEEKLTAEEHSLVISELLPGILYHFKVKSREATSMESESEDFTFSTFGYQVEIKVLNIANNQPLIGAEVTFPGPPEIIKTVNEEGKAVFDHLPLGKNWISVKYRDTSLSYLFEVLSKEEPQSFEVKFEIPKPKPKVWQIFVILILLIIAVILIIILRLLKRKSRPTIPFRGFTLIELLAVIGTITVLMAATITAINPFRQFTQAKNTQRWTHIRAILDAIDQNLIDNKGTFVCPAGPIPPPRAAAIMGDRIGQYNMCPCIAPLYIVLMPIDSTAGTPPSIPPCTGYSSGYRIFQNATSGRITVEAPSAELGETISVTR